MDWTTVDWVGVAGTAGAIMTAIIVGVSTYWVRRQALMYGPAIEIHVSREEAADLPLARVSLIRADQERFMISHLTIKPRSARLIVADSVQDSFGQPHPRPSTTRVRSFYPSPGRAPVEVFVDCGKASEATMEVHIASKSDSKVRSRRKVRISKKD